MQKICIHFGIVALLAVRACGLDAVGEVQLSGYAVERDGDLGFTFSLSDPPLFAVEDPRGAITSLNKLVVLHGQLRRYPVDGRPSVRVQRIEPANPHGDDVFPLSASVSRAVPGRRALLRDELFHEMRKRQGQQAHDHDRDGTPDAFDEDDDNDGMPDTYEDANELNALEADGGEDLDGDGFINLHEFLAGTAANDPDSLLRIQSTLRNDPLWTLTWMSVTGKTYGVYAAPEPGGAFTLIRTGVPAAPGGTTSREVPSSAPHAIFYIELQP